MTLYDDYERVEVKKSNAMAFSMIFGLIALFTSVIIMGKYWNMENDWIALAMIAIGFGAGALITAIIYYFKKKGIVDVWGDYEAEEPTIDETGQTKCRQDFEIQNIGGRDNFICIKKLA